MLTQLFLMINRVLRKIAQNQGQRMLIVAPTWQRQVWYPAHLRISIERPLLLPHHQHLLLNHQAINNEQNIKISGLDNFRQIPLATGISEEASKLISSTRRQGS